MFQPLTGSLPAIFRTSETSFRRHPPLYLMADSLEQDRFLANYSDGRRLVGLAWLTRNQRTGRRRCIDLKSLAPLFALPGIRWISLQYGDFDPLEAQAAQAGAPLLIDRTVDQLADMDRFACSDGYGSHNRQFNGPRGRSLGPFGLAFAALCRGLALA